MLITILFRISQKKKKTIPFPLYIFEYFINESLRIAEAFLYKINNNNNKNYFGLTQTNMTLFDFHISIIFQLSSVSN